MFNKIGSSLLPLAERAMVHCNDDRENINPAMPTFQRKGTLSGTNTVDTIEFSVEVPATISYTVTATGEGNNELRVRSQKRAVMVWAEVHDFKLDPGESKTKSFEAVNDMTNPTNDGKQDIRIKLSRKILTKELEWEVNWTVN